MGRMASLDAASTAHVGARAQRFGSSGLALRGRVGLGAFVAALLIGCTDGEPGGSIRSVFALPSSWEALAETSFFDHPWPSDLRVEDGHVRLAGYYNPVGLPLYAEYVSAMDGVLDGFSPVAAGYVRFTGAIDPASLPADPKAGLAPSSAVQLVDVDPASPERGQRHLVSLEWRREEGVYWRADTLAFMPTIGFPLRPRTRYALVVTDALRAVGGGEVTAADELTQALGLAEPATDAARTAKAALAPVVAELAAAGVTTSSIVHLAAFTTNDPTAETFAARDALVADVAPPTAHADAWKFERETDDYVEYTGVYGPSPNFQEGTIPFTKYGDGGAMHYEGGKPAPVDMFDLRFSLCVPLAAACPMPPAGYPIVMYAHGTGGDYRSYTLDGTAAALARRCLASMGVDQIFHGTRPGSPGNGDVSQIELLFFNFQNVVAARTNNRQSALDEVQRARLFTESHMTIPPSIATTGAQISFDGGRLMFFGHSQGGLNGPLFLASDGAPRGAVLSGSSSLIEITLLEKTKPDPSVAGLVQTVFLGLGGAEGDELSFFHPAISLAQTIVDVVDPIHYAPITMLSPRAGNGAKSVYMTEGINPDGTGDSYAPPHGIEAQAIAMGLPLQLPSQRAIVESQWGGPAPVTVPAGGLSKNVGGEASGVLAQWPVPANSDGHFVVFDVPQARTQAADFLRRLADDPAGNVPPP